MIQGYNVPKKCTPNVHIRTSQIVTYWANLSRKKIFVKGYSSILYMAFVVINKIFQQNFYLYVTVYSVRIWTYKKAG